LILFKIIKIQDRATNIENNRLKEMRLIKIPQNVFNEEKLLKILLLKNNN